jgi:hypothetical protein
MIVKDILSGKVCSETELRISSFKPSGLRELLQTLSGDHFILGVGYDQGDFQICISGRKKNNENINHTFNREMYEELSLVPKTLPLQYTKTGNNYYTSVRITDTYLLPPNLFSESNIDDTKERGIICVYGTFTEIISYMTSVGIDPNNNDSITHIWADKVKNVLDYF